MRRLATGLIGLVLLLPVASASAQVPRKFRVAVIPGVQEFLVSQVMDREQLFKKYNLDPQLQKLVSPTAVHPLITEGKVDIGFGGFATMAIARSQGRPVVVSFSRVASSS